MSTGITGRLISVPAQNSATWTKRTADISAYIGCKAELVILYQSGSSFRGDVQLDDFNIGGNTYDVLSNNSQGFLSNFYSDDVQLTNPDNIQTDFDNVSLWVAIGPSESVTGRFSIDTGGTPSSGTGLTAGNTGTAYIYAETSGSASNNDFWLRSPEVTITDGELSFYTAQYGTNCGPIYAYLNVTEGNTAASGWGRSTWGSSIWGGVEATFSVSGSAATGSIGDDVTVVAEANIPPTGLLSTGSIGDDVTVIAEAVVTESNGLSATGSIGDDVTVVAEANISATGPPSARGNPDLAGAINAEYFVPTDSNDPNIKVMAFQDSTTVFADGVSQGTISSAGGTLSITAANYENKLISADKPITLQSSNNETTGVPTSWQGTSFGFRNLRTGVVLQLRSISGTASVQIFKDGVLTTTLSVPDNTTTTQTYADDTSDPEYTVISDLPIVGMKAANDSFATDSHPLFPASTEIYGFAASNGYVHRVDNYGSGTASYIEYRSNNTSTGATTISTVRTTGGNASDYTGPAIRAVIGDNAVGVAYADGDGGEKSSWVAESAFAHEFRLIEAAEFLAIIGAPGTKGKNINVFNSSGTLIDTVQLDADTTDANYPTKFQLISNASTEADLQADKKSYDLTAGMRIVSEVPVYVVVEDLQNNEENLFGLRHFGGEVAVITAVAVDGSQATGSIGDDVTIIAEAVVTESNGLSATGSIGDDVTIIAEANTPPTGLLSTGSIGDDVTIIAEAVVTESNGLSATGSIGDDVTVTGLANVVPDGSQATGSIGDDVTVTGLANVAPETGLSATGSIGDDVTVIAEAVVTESNGLSATGSIGDDVTVTGLANLVLDGSDATGSIGDDVTVIAEANIPETGLSATGIIGDGDGDDDDVTVTGLANVVPDGSQATGIIGDDVTVRIITAVAVDGSQATGSIGDDVTVTGLANVVPDGSQVTGSIGDDVTVTGSAVVTESNGLQSNTAVGTLDSITGSAVVSLTNTDLLATGFAGNALVWGEVVPNQSPNWTAETPSQSPNWGAVTPNQSPNWTAETPSQSPDWSEITPSQSPDWEDIAA